MKLVLENKNQPDMMPDPGGVLSTPAIDEDYWLFRVKVSETQAIVGFPFFLTIGIGFARKRDWHLPYTCDAEEIYDHIEPNKGNSISREDCLTAIRTVQEAAKDHMNGAAR